MERCKQEYSMDWVFKPLTQKFYHNIMWAKIYPAIKPKKRCCIKESSATPKIIHDWFPGQMFGVPKE
jgi:hypothetical protein